MSKVASRSSVPSGGDLSSRERSRSFAAAGLPGGLGVGVRRVREDSNKANKVDTKSPKRQSDTPRYKGSIPYLYIGLRLLDSGNSSSI